MIHLMRLYKFYTDAGILILGGISIILCFMAKNSIMNSAVIFVCIYTFSGFISWVYNRNADIQELLWPIGFMGIGLLFTVFTISYRITSVIYLVFIIMISSLVILNGGMVNSEYSAIRNGVSVGSLLFFSMHMIAAYQNKATVSLVYPLLMLFVNFMAVGRSGVLVSLLCVAFFVLFSYKSGKAHMRESYLIIVCIILLSVCCAFLYIVYPHIFLDVMDNFSRRGLKSGRLNMWGDYILQCWEYFPNILFGSRIEGTELLNMFRENLHNAWIMLHAKYGITGVILCLYLLTRAVYRLVRNSNMYLLTPLVLIFFRMNFDYTNFNGLLDSVLIVYIVYGMISKRSFEKV